MGRKGWAGMTALVLAAGSLAACTSSPSATVVKGQRTTPSTSTTTEPPTTTTVAPTTTTTSTTAPPPTTTTVPLVSVPNATPESLGIFGSEKLLTDAGLNYQVQRSDSGACWTVDVISEQRVWDTNEILAQYPNPGALVPAGSLVTLQVC